MGVPIPEKSIDFQIMVDSLDLFGRLAWRDRRLANTSAVVYDAVFDVFLSRLVAWKLVWLIDVRLPGEVILAVDSCVSYVASIWWIASTSMRIVQLQLQAGRFMLADRYDR